MAVPDKIAVITPYRDEPRTVLERSLDSVASQSVPCDHYLVADGPPQTWIDGQVREHLGLGRAHDDYGNAARSAGALLAHAEGYTVIAMLDPGDRFEPDHVEQCLAAADRAGRERCDLVYARCETEQAWQADGSRLAAGASGLVFLMGAFRQLALWASVPKPLMPLTGRLVRILLERQDLVSASPDKVTVRTGPAAAAADADGIGRWLDGLSERDGEIACRSLWLPQAKKNLEKIVSRALAS